MTEIRFTIGANPPARLDKALARDVPEAAALSRSRLSKLLAEGAVSVNGAVARDGKAKVAEGDEVAVTVGAPEPTHILPQEMALDIRHEDSDLIVVMKPAGMVVHPAPGSPDGTLVNGLLAHCGDTLSGVGGMARPGVVHRIDKDTSGLLVVAKTDKAHQGLAAQFAEHSVDRAYLALSHGVPSVADPRVMGLAGVRAEDGGLVVRTQLGRHKTDRQKQAVQKAGGRHAVTRVRVLEDFAAQAALLECRLETGRTHQIRVHMAYLGHALIGDTVYGGRRTLSAKVDPKAAEAAKGFARQALHAARLGFVHPVTGDTLTFEADLPDDMAQLLTVLGGM